MSNISTTSSNELVFFKKKVNTFKNTLSIIVGYEVKDIINGLIQSDYIFDEGSRKDFINIKYIIVDKFKVFGHWIGCNEEMQINEIIFINLYMTSTFTSSKLCDIQDTIVIHPDNPILKDLPDTIKTI